MDWLCESIHKVMHMIKPEVLASELPHGPWSCRGSDVWDVLQAAASGDVASLGRLRGRDPNLCRAEYWYTQPIHFAVREGHLATVKLLLDAGADPAAERMGREDLITLARDRGHERVAQLLEETRADRGRISLTEIRIDHPIFDAAAAGDLASVRKLLDSDPLLVHCRDRAGGTPLHRAVAASARAVVTLLLDRGADLHAIHEAGPGSERGYAAADFQPIDLALWSGPFWSVRGDLETARLLIDRGAAYDLVIASALGDLAYVNRVLDEEPHRIIEKRPCGKRPLSTAVEFMHPKIVHLLLDRGADPNGSEGSTAPRGVALHAASRAGDRQLVEQLLAHGADPNGSINSSGSATYAARTPELRAFLLANGGILDNYDLIWLGEDDEVLRRVRENPSSANAGCGGVLAAACKQGKRELLVRLLDKECATILLDAGADIAAKDEDYRSTPLAWAARNNLPDMVELLLARGASINLPDDEPRATPLAWAMRRGYCRIMDILRAAGATA